LYNRPCLHLFELLAKAAQSNHIDMAHPYGLPCSKYFGRMGKYTDASEPAVPQVANQRSSSYLAPVNPSIDGPRRRPRSLKQNLRSSASIDTLSPGVVSTSNFANLSENNPEPHSYQPSKSKSRQATNSSQGSHSRRASIRRCIQNLEPSFTESPYLCSAAVSNPATRERHTFPSA